MGDFNQLPIKLNNYSITICSRILLEITKILDKRFTRVKNGYSHCHQLPKLGRSDHYVMHLIPSYKPLSKLNLHMSHAINLHIRIANLYRLV